MISRIGAANGTGHGFFPQYGVSGVYAKAANHGFEDTFQASFTMAMEWGCFEYARGLLHNWLSYYLIVRAITPLGHAAAAAPGHDDRGAR